MADYRARGSLSTPLPHDPVRLVFARLCEHGCHPKRSGDGWAARCPAHEDRNPSLAIREGDDGRALVHCHAGCPTADVCSALGLTLADLMPVNSVSVNGIRSTPRKTAIPLTPDPKPAGPAFATLAEAVAHLERRHGPRAALWTYHDAEGEPVGAVVRWDLADGNKDIRPLAKTPGGWRTRAMPEPRPIYGLPEVLALPDGATVYVTEGEKAADAARSLGLVAVTSAGGAKAADKTDWTPLAGKAVVILPDNDTAGRVYAEKVAKALAGRVRSIRIVELPGLPEGGDIVEWIDAHGDAAEPDVMAAELAGMVADAPEWFPPTELEPARNEYLPFPVDALPEPVRGFVLAGARAMLCDPSFIALPLLTALAAAIGNTRRLRLKKSWKVPPILWTVIVGESGTLKSPPWKLALEAVHEQQERALREYQEALKAHEAEMELYAKEKQKWLKARSSGDPPTKPERPVQARYLVKDTTVEALASKLLENPRGVLAARDELSALFGSFDRYAKAGKTSADAAHYLSMYNGDSLLIDRKTGIPPTIYVPHAATCITGTIQPAILRKVLAGEHSESGLAARFLFACPPRRPKQWTEADIDRETKAAVGRLFDRLRCLEGEQVDEHDSRPILVDLSPEAKQAWTDFYNAHNREQVDTTGDLAAAWSKLEEIPARLALVIHYARWAAGDPTLATADEVDVTSIRAGITLAEWFKHEARRVYDVLHESAENAEQRRLVEWLERRGGSATARDVQAGCRWLREPGAAEAVLIKLVKAGLGAWEATPPGQRGQPTRRFRLTTHQAVNGIQVFPEENSNTVDVDTIDGSDSQADDGWGEV